jgi:cytochrome c-type biogenesis protein CcmE
MKRKHKRLAYLLFGLAALGGAAALVLAAFSDNLVFFYSPTELAASQRAGQRIRIGGLVELQSLAHEDGRRVSFRVTDGKTDVAVTYDGALPDLFREGQGVVAEGHLGADGVFVATTILAKHDERYMPPEVVDALKKSGRWQENSGDPGTLAGRPPAHIP